MHALDVLTYFFFPFTRKIWPSFCGTSSTISLQSLSIAYTYESQLHSILSLGATTVVIFVHLISPSCNLYVHVVSNCFCSCKMYARASLHLFRSRRLSLRSVLLSWICNVFTSCMLSVRYFAQVHFCCCCPEHGRRCTRPFCRSRAVWINL